MNYPGGKGGVYKRLISLMPPHEVYIETHLGGGSVIRNKRQSKRNIGIEINADILKKWEQEDQEGIELINTEALKYLGNYNFTGKELVYSDPPYPRSTRKKRKRIYKYEYTEEQHISLLRFLKRLPCMVMISSYESELYKDELGGWHTHSFQAATHNGLANEWVWMNYPPPVELHDYRFIGNTFRERERIKRKTTRWLSRLQSMPVLERQALLWAIDKEKEESFGN